MTLMIKNPPTMCVFYIVYCLTNALNIRKGLLLDWWCCLVAKLNLSLL